MKSITKFVRITEVELILVVGKCCKWQGSAFGRVE